MITKEIWKKYSEQIDILNSMKIADCEEANRKMRADHEKSRAEYYRSMNERDAKTGKPTLRYYPMFLGFCLPMLRKKSVEDCMDWIIKGQPSMAKKIIVKSNGNQNN